jgi:AcrR family transcriptional regulator
MLENSGGASTEELELETLPPEAQAFHRRARILDATVREIAEHGYGQAAVAGIAERAGVTRRAFYDTFVGKEEALIWAYDVAAAYAIPQILRALRAERSWERGAAAALSTYLAILDCDRAWALVCLRDVPAASERARAARDAVRAPILEALEGQETGASAGGVGVETMLTAIDAITVDGLRYDPENPLSARQPELTAFALAPFVKVPEEAAPAAHPTVRLSTSAGEIAALLDDGAAGEAGLELVVREAASMRDGPALWHVIAAVQRRRAAGQHVAERAEQVALEALGEAWFFGLALDRPAAAIPSADRRYLRYVATHPGSSGAEILRGLGLRHLSQVNRTLRRLQAQGLLRREPGVGRANGWWPTSKEGEDVQKKETGR